MTIRGRDCLPSTHWNLVPKLASPASALLTGLELFLPASCNSQHKSCLSLVPASCWGRFLRRFVVFPLARNSSWHWQRFTDGYDAKRHCWFDLDKGFPGEVAWWHSLCQGLVRHPLETSPGAPFLPGTQEKLSQLLLTSSQPELLIRSWKLSNSKWGPATTFSLEQSPYCLAENIDERKCIESRKGTLRDHLCG